MQTRSRQDAYRVFLEFVSNDIQKERRQVNRRMLGVFFWCFLAPAIISIGLLALVKAGLLPRSSRSMMDWAVLVFPVTYTLYILGSEVLKGLPAMLRRGGIANTLSQSSREGEWRSRVCEEMERAVQGEPAEWAWIVSSYKMDLELLKNRTWHLTALAGAVFFLVMQGIDSLGDSEPKTSWIKSPVGWIDISDSQDFTQFIAMGLVLVLLYLSGNQSYQLLSRYLNSARLIELMRGKDDRASASASRAKDGIQVV